jgi:integrase
MKGDKAHVVPLSDAALAIIETLPRMKGSDFVFTTTGATPVSGTSRAKDRLDAALLKAAQEAAKEAGSDPAKVEPMPHWTFHDFRRTMASGMARLRINLPVIERLLAHTSGSFGGIVGVYQRHHFNDEKREALQAWANWLRDLIEPKQPNVVILRKGKA